MQVSYMNGRIWNENKSPLLAEDEKERRRGGRERRGGAGEGGGGVEWRGAVDGRGGREKREEESEWMNKNGGRRKIRDRFPRL